MNSTLTAVLCPGRTQHRHSMCILVRPRRQPVPYCNLRSLSAMYLHWLRHRRSRSAPSDYTPLILNGTASARNNYFVRVTVRTHAVQYGSHTRISVYRTISIILNGTTSARNNYFVRVTVRTHGHAVQHTLHVHVLVFTEQIVWMFAIALSRVRSTEYRYSCIGF